MRHGWRTSRKSHSRPAFRIQAGARGTRPVRKSKAPPTPIATATPSRLRSRSIHSSCAGAPNATSKTCEPCSWISLSVSASCAGSGPPECDATSSVGLARRSVAASSPATPGAAPRRNSRNPRRAHIAASGWIRSTPDTVSRKAQPWRRAAHTTPIPSGRHSPADSSTRANSRSRCARITNSGFTVATRWVPPSSTNCSIRPSVAPMPRQSTLTPRIRASVKRPVGSGVRDRRRVAPREPFRRLGAGKQWPGAMSPPSRRGRWHAPRPLA